MRAPSGCCVWSWRTRRARRRSPGRCANDWPRVYAAIVGNGYGQFDPILRDLGPAPGPEGLGHLRQPLETLRARVTSNGQAKTHREWIVRIAMLDIANALRDAQAYCAARLVLATPKPLNGDLHELFAPVGEVLEKNHPLAATRCLPSPHLPSLGARDQGLGQLGGSPHLRDPPAPRSRPQTWLVEPGAAGGGAESASSRDRPTGSQEHGSSGGDEPSARR